MKLKRIRVLSLATLSAFVLNGCMSTGDGPPSYQVDVSSIPNAVPRVLPRSKYGNPKTYEVYGKTYHVMHSAKGFEARGIASWYGTKFHERRTSSGEPYDMLAMTAAHKTLPLPTFLRVTNLQNGRQIIVKVNDRGPFVENRLIDLSYAAAKKLDMLKKGTALVYLQAITPGKHSSVSPRHAPGVISNLNSSVMYLQVGAFRDQQAAITLAEKCRHLTQYPVKENAIHVGAHLLYRVWVGPIHEVDVADYLTRHFETHGISEPRVIVPKK